jgi:hypothetical protein
VISTIIPPAEPGEQDDGLDEVAMRCGLEVKDDRNAVPLLVRPGVAYLMMA